MMSETRRAIRLAGGGEMDSNQIAALNELQRRKLIRISHAARSDAATSTRVTR